MKKILFLILVVFCLVGCKQEEETVQWEYKIHSVYPEKSFEVYLNNLNRRVGGKSEYEDFMPVIFEDPTFSLNQFGKEGWEIIAVYTTVETAFPNFGKEDLHVGVKSNTRTDKVNFVFKRKLKLDKNNKDLSVGKDNIPEISDIE